MNTITKFKFFFAHQDREQEQWLRSMAQQGLHLTGVNAASFWTFRQGEPADVVFRVDFDNAHKVAGYRVLFEDAGWHLAAQLTGWQYWCKPTVDGREPEIYTDLPSKTAKFKRMLAFLFLMVLPLTLGVLTRPQVVWDLSPPFAVTVVAMLALYAYQMGALLLRIRAAGRDAW